MDRNPLTHYPHQQVARWWYNHGVNTVTIGMMAVYAGLMVWYFIMKM